MDGLQTVGGLVKDVGFPIFICVWLLTRTDTYVRELTVAVKELSALIRDTRGKL